MSACSRCGQPMTIGDWPFCPHGRSGSLTVIDDELLGGARVFENLGHEPVYVASKSQLRREMAARGLQLRDAHDEGYFKAIFKRHDEELRDTGRNREY